MPDGPGVAAIVACIDSAGRVLVVKQTAGPFAGAWLLPGGAVKRGEQVEAAARREVTEETGYSVDTLGLVARYEVRSVPPGAFHFLLHMFRAGEITGTARPEGGSEVRWTHSSELDLHPSMAVELTDLGLIEGERATLCRALGQIGVEMHRLP